MLTSGGYFKFDTWSKIICKDKFIRFYFGYIKMENIRKEKLVGYILAAGDSTRLKRLTSDKPKSFLEIEGKKIIDYHLYTLARGGIRDTYIVVGFLKDLFKETIGNGYNGMRVHYVDNDEYETTNHSHSVFLGRDVFRRHPILLIHADEFYDPLILEDLIDTNFDNVLTANDRRDTNEEFVVVGNNGIVEAVGPGKIGNIQGEYVGLSRFSSEFMMAFCNYMKDFFVKNGRGFQYEIVMDEFLRTSSLKLHYQNIGRRAWININYLEDYQKVQRIAEEISKEDPIKYYNIEGWLGTHSFVVQSRRDVLNYIGDPNDKDSFAGEEGLQLNTLKRVTEKEAKNPKKV